MQGADHAKAVGKKETVAGLCADVFSDGMIRLQTVRYTLQHTS